MSDEFFRQKRLEGVNGKICYFINQKFNSKPTVVFLHGLSSNHTIWLLAAQAAYKLGLNCLLVDLRGHGHSDKRKKRKLYKISVFTRDLKDIIEKENISQVIFVGYSFGGFIALDYVIKYPADVAGLILISTNHVNPFKYKYMNFLTWPSYAGLILLSWLFLWQRKKKYYYFDQETAKGYWQSTFKGFTTMPISINLWMLAEVANVNFGRDIEKISCPTLIIKSQNDPFLTPAEADEINRKIKLSKLLILDESSHFLATRYQEKISEIIIYFLEKIKFI